ncbi:bifunctional diguanylate cyclase/phosphodiesterase [Ornithinibacillus xuwenensis]|uniref:Bifunctional diguanylate cyclase/phosphodiesterase n=1 Tax=Ornithinibacillus xuwenensis TaxID=3144668 RepID=A0ABU9XJM6_9BACI
MAKYDFTQSDSIRLFFQNSETVNKVSQDAPDMDRLLSYYASLGNNHPDIMLVFSPEGELLSTNQKPVDGFLDSQFDNIVDFKRILLKKSFEQLNTAFQNALAGSTERIEVQVKWKKRYYENTLIPLQSTNDQVEGIILIAKEVTVHKQLDIKTKHENKSYKLIFDHLHMGIWVIEYRNGKLVYASKGLEDLLQFPIEDIYIDKLNIDNVIETVVHPDDREQISEHATEILKNGDPIHIRFRIICPDGSIKWVRCHTAPYHDDGKITHIFGMLTDITDEVKLQEKLRYTANHDLLTTLPNKRSLDAKLDSLLEEEKPFALLFFNLDRFSVINGSLGYQVGDEVLKTIATRLLLILPENSFIARLKSNDFVIVLEDYRKKESLISKTENLIHDIKQPLTINGYEINLTTSIGISLYPEDGSTSDDLMDKAHSALGYAKKSGKNTFQLYSFSKDTAFQRKLAIENDMIEALEKEEFELYYQPLVETQSGTILGAEALIRWNHKDWGLISPGEFIPIAEENHLITEISDWVIKKACSQLKEWKDKGLQPIPISVNLSPIRLMKKGLTDYVKRQLETFQVPAEFLGVEITESSLLKSEQGVVATLAELKELGVRIAIDDFGTGFSSLNYLREYQADTLKIDQVFIQSRDGQVEKDNVIVGSVMQMAKGLNMRIVAEGVEEYGQYRFLRNRECDLIQGYLFSRPVPVTDFEGLLVKGKLEPDPVKIEKDRQRRKNKTT